MLLRPFTAEAAPNTERVFIISLLYDKGELAKENIYTAKGDYIPEKIFIENNYRAEILDFNDNTMANEVFTFSLIRITENGIEQIDQAIKTLILPYFDNAKIINIYSPKDEKILEIDVSYFAEKIEPQIFEQNQEQKQEKLIMQKISSVLVWQYLLAIGLVIVLIISIIWAKKRFNL